MLSDRIKKFGLQSNTEPGSDPKTEQPDGAAVTDSTADEGGSAQDKVAGAKAVPSASNDNAAQQTAAAAAEDATEQAKQALREAFERADAERSDAAEQYVAQKLEGAIHRPASRVQPSRIKSADDRQNVSEEEIKYMVSEQDDLLDEEKRMIHEIFDLGDTVAREVMVPRVDTTMCEDDETVADVLSTMRQTGFSRIPVYHEDPDNVAGIAHIKDLIQPALDGKGDQPIADFLRDGTFVPGTKDNLPLLSEMHASHDQVAAVEGEYGGTAGIITIEDIVEEIVGEIEDEFDPDNKYLTRLSRREWLVDGRFSCDDAIELGWPLEESDDYETIAGWILELCDSVPDIGEVFEVAGYKFKVQSMRGQRISLIRVIAPAETDKKDSESSVDEPTTSGAGSANPHDGDE